MKMVCDESVGSKVYSIYLYRFPNGKVYVGMTHNTMEKRRDQGYQHNQYSIDGELINSYVNILEASRKTGVNRSCISDCANHKQKTSHGYVWSFTKGGGFGEAFR